MTGLFETLRDQLVRYETMGICVLLLLHIATIETQSPHLIGPPEAGPAAGTGMERCLAHRGFATNRARG